MALKEGNKAPMFNGLDENGNSIKLSDFAGKKVVLYFYPKDNTPGCTAESCSLRDGYIDLTEAGYEVIGVSPDSMDSHKKFIAKHQLNFHLIADTEQVILKAYEAWGEKNLYGKKSIGVLRKTYLIDESGTILKIFKRVDTKAHAEQILNFDKK